MARTTTRERRKMANTSDAPSSASSLLTGSTKSTFGGGPTTPVPSTTTFYSTYEGYTFNYTGLDNGLGGYTLDDLSNYTELWVDVWNKSEGINITERLNATFSTPGSSCDEWEAAQHKLFQVIFPNYF